MNDSETVRPVIDHLLWLHSGEQRACNALTGQLKLLASIPRSGPLGLGFT
jgi:hypothetical protein